MKYFLYDDSFDSEALGKPGNEEIFNILYHRTETTLTVITQGESL